MAEPLPAALKKPEISRFINRANQLRSIKPAIAYWCEYHAVNQIVGKSLHTADDDCFNFTRTLIERLEATKTERADDDAIVDNTAGQAYVEQFAQETFDRAERAMIADKVTRQTADTFDAAATFFDLTHEWGTPDAETLQKIKFAKWNAARILKAIREGKDPNESNPKRTEPEPEEEEQLQPQLGDQADAPVDLTGDGDNDNTTNTHHPQPVSVQHVPDTGEPILPQPPASAPAPDPSTSVPSEPPFSPSPMTMSPPPPAASQPTPPPAPGVPPLQPSPQIPTKVPSQYMPPTDPATASPASAPPPAPVGRAPPSAPISAPAPAPIQQAPPPQTAQPTTNMHHKDLNQAQKHAKWAISALNFEDVPTAVQELRNALAMLGE